MSINLTDELHAATTKGKIASAKEVYLEGDKENLQQVGEKTHQLEEAIKDISASGGASTANAVSYDNADSGMTAVTAQGAIDELAAKDKSQDVEIEKKANSSDVDSQMQTEQTRVNAELDKKFDKENVAQELGDSEDKVVSQYALPFRIEESPEWVYLIKDADDHVLFGIQQDGSVEWGAGIPSPVRVKIKEVIDKEASDKEELDTKTDSIKTELSALIDTLNTSFSEEIQNLKDTKVDKEEGKSLIDDEVKQHFEVIENEEWLTLMTDAEDHILFGIKRDTGKPYFPLNEMYHVEQSPEFFALWKDAEDHILMGIRRDGEIVGEIHAVNALKQTITDIQSDVETLKSNVSTIDASLQELLNVFSLQENPEFLAVETDAEGKMLAYTKNDGSHYAYNMKSETIPEEFSHIEDPEGRMAMETDAEQKILAYRDKEGVKHEHEAEVNTLHVSNLDLKDNSVNDIQSALIANGFNVKTPIDWSESSFIQIPEPRFAIINITNIDSMPTTKTQNKKAYLEFWDMQGNYFKKHAILNAQGDSSMLHVKKNIAVDICNDQWLGDDVPKIRIGEWVPQDSFHVKAYYTDFFRGVCPVTYKFYNEIVRNRGIMSDRPWKKALIDTSSIGTFASSLGNSNIGDFNVLLDSGARCFPDGFPVACYLNGTFYGIFSWQLKKHRDNYHLDKSNEKHVHLDGTLYKNTIFNGKENIDWSQFEIRNPKGLYAIGGNKYNADIKQEEIAGESEVNTWIETGQLPDGTTISSKIKKDLLITANVKKYIYGLAEAVPTINNAMEVYESSEKTEDDLKTFKSVYETFFDKENMIDFMIVSDLTRSTVRFEKNWQWFTYDGIKWWVGLYDCDLSFGNSPLGDYQLNTLKKAHLDESIDKPTGYVAKYYADEMEQTYKQLADKDIISVSHIYELLHDWTMRIGSDFYKEEFKKWSDSPCMNNSVVNNEYWEVLLDGEGKPQSDTKSTFDATMQYNVGDVASFGIANYMGFFKFRCIKETKPLQSDSANSVSTYSPIKQFRYCDNIYRIGKWIEKNIENMDFVYKYNRN